MKIVIKYQGRCSMESIGIRNILDMKCDLSSEQTHTIGANRSQTQNKSAAH